MKTNKEKDGAMREKNIAEMKEEEEEKQGVEGEKKEEIVNSKNLINQNMNQNTKKLPKKILKIMEAIHHRYLPLLNLVNSREKK